MPPVVKDGVDNTPIREAVIRAVANGSITMQGLAEELEYFRMVYANKGVYRLSNGDKVAYTYNYTEARRVGDSVRLKRKLGLLPNRSRGYVTYVDKINYDLALRIIELLHLDPVDVGL